MAGYKELDFDVTPEIETLVEWMMMHESEKSDLLPTDESFISLARAAGRLESDEVVTKAARLATLTLWG